MMKFIKYGKTAVVFMITALLTVCIGGCGSDQAAGAGDQGVSDQGVSDQGVGDQGVGDQGAGVSGDKTKLTVFAAASLTDVAEELGEVYKTKHGDVELVFSFGSSGALRTQIEEGALADIFISAATDHMGALDEEGLMAKDSVRELLENKIVLVVPENSDKGIASYEDLDSEKVTLIGMGEPESVPAGKYAKELLTNMGLFDKLEQKLNYGTDVRAVLAWVETGEVDCGIVYATDAYSTDKVRIVDEAPEGMVSKVIYPAGVTDSCEHKAEAEEFLDFLESDEAAKIFEKYGFTRVG